MIPNSCVYEATRQVVENQFGISLSRDVFDKNNTGDGIRLSRIAKVINDSLRPHGIAVIGVYGKFNDESDFDNPELLRPPQFVDAPCIAYDGDCHAFAVLPNDGVKEATLVIKLGLLA